MSMWSPLEPNLGHREDGIPAADPGPGAPETAPGTGIGGEEPDPVDPTLEVPAPGSDGGADEPDGGDGEDPPFRTPDPHDVGRR